MRKGEGHVDRRALAAEINRAAVISALEHHDQVLAGDGAGGDQGHRVGLGARVGEAHLLDGGEAGADERRQPLLVGAGRAVGHAVVEGRSQGLADHRMRVAVESGGEIADEVGVGVAVDIGERCAGRLLDREREGRVEHARAGIAAGHALLRPLVLRPAGGIGAHIARLHLVDRAVQVEIPAAHIEPRCHVAPRCRLRGGR